jgi:hypothetical protein
MTNGFYGSKQPKYHEVPVMTRTVEREFISRVSTTAGANGAGFLPCQGLYHRPSGEYPKVAFIASHYNVDFAEHYLGRYLAERGFGFLGWNTRYRGNEAFFNLEHALIDIGVGVRWLREEAGVEYIAIIGNSGGGSLMGAYQSQACDPNISPSRGLSLPEAVLELIPCDYYISLNAHLGRPEVLTSWFDPCVVDETDPIAADPSLDMYAAQNCPPYSEAFVTRYRAAQVQRNQRITAWCIAQLASLAEQDLWDRAFPMYRTWADLRMMDPTLDPSERSPGRCYAGDPRRANYSPRGIGLSNTCRSWLSMWSLEESQCRATPHLQRIWAPSLVLQSTGDTGVFPNDAQAIYGALGASDKTLEFMPGDHYLIAPAQGRDQVAERIAGWISQYTG